MNIVRELVLDTETTGLSPELGDKIVEIGIVELINHVPTEKTFHHYLNPERSMPEAAFKIHGLSFEFLQDKPVFGDIAIEMLQFIGNDPIIIHNAQFDLKFLNTELSGIQKMPITSSQVIDTLFLAREKFPGSPASLDALCRRFSISNSHRELHGALLDSYILAKVYLELIGGSQPNFELTNVKNHKNLTNSYNIANEENKHKSFMRTTRLENRLSKQEIEDHKKFIHKINGLTKWTIYN